MKLCNVILIPIACNSHQARLAFVIYGFQSQGGSLALHSSLPVCNATLKFTSGVTPADVLAAGISERMFLIHVLRFYTNMFKHCEILSKQYRKERCLNTSTVNASECLFAEYTLPNIGFNFRHDALSPSLIAWVPQTTEFLWVLLNL